MTIAPTAEIRRRQGELGQFLTPAPIAAFMASMFGELPGAVRLLDPGAGAGALTKAFVKRCCASVKRPESIEATLYEVDPNILESLSDTLEECE